MSFYAATTRNNGLYGSVQGRPVLVSEADGTIRIRFTNERRCIDLHTLSERFAQRYRQHPLSNSRSWWVIFFIALVVILGPYYYVKNKENPPICESDRSYPTAVLLSMFLGVFGVDRFYLGYIFVGFLKFFTVGGFGLLWAADIVLILVGGLPDHKGCALVSS
ncbi:MAG: hypothetical protein JOS17DRAFT_798946 [Linnemannia elongata]|nr:MAG: hypothetical protein JOS17DRAFT_798946 [Linnemannia elongata]